jgi:hypothetical protein
VGGLGEGDGLGDGGVGGLGLGEGRGGGGGEGEVGGGGGDEQRDGAHRSVCLWEVTRDVQQTELQARCSALQCSTASNSTPGAVQRMQPDC